MSENDDLIQAQGVRLAQLEQQIQQDGVRIAELEEQRERELAALHEVVDGLRARVNCSQAQIHEIETSLYKTVAEQGKENGYCQDGMADFCSRVLSITREEAYEGLAQYFQQRVEVRIIANIQNSTEDHVTLGDAEAFITEVLDCEVVDIEIAHVSIDDM